MSLGKSIATVAIAATLCAIPSLPVLAAYVTAPPAPDGIPSAPPATFEEALAQCDTGSFVQQSDCIGEAQLAFCEFIPFTPDSPHYREDIDGPCLAWEQEQEQIDADMAELETTE